MNLICPDCENQIEVIKACGCNDYFCNHCNQLVSKSRVIDLDSTTASEKSANDQPSKSGTGH